ncbi:metalloprotease family M17, partial [Thraustotheca clavata]
MVKYLANVASIVRGTSLPKLLLIGTTETSGLGLGTRILEQLKDPVDPTAVSLLQHTINELKATLDTPVSSHVYLPLGDDEFLSCTVAKLPTAVSRHNSFARPHAISALVKANAASWEKSTLVGLDLPSHATQEVWKTGAFAVARGVSSYSHKSTEQRGVITDGIDTEYPQDNVEVVLEQELSEEQVHELNCTAEAIRLTQRLVDAPPSELNTDTFVAEAEAVAARCGAQITVIRGEELRERGFGGIYGVGKAAEHPPALAILSYYPPDTSDETKSIALVGKGIVYDTGGLDLKISGFMVGMKADMGGAAGLLGGFQACVLSGA